jgi:carbon monoxide dehydrogenase subunit G
MRFENHFDVDAPIEEVWRAVLDVERVAPNVPGAQVLGRTGEDAYKVAIKVKVGPMSMTYRGEVAITDRDDDAHRAVMRARAKESRGQGTANADVTMLLDGANGRTSATVTTDVELSGKVATMGQGVLQDVSGRLMNTFAANLAAMLEAGEPGPEAAEAAAPAAAGEPGPEAAAHAASAASAASAAPAEAAPPGSAGPTPPRAPTTPPAPADALDLGAVGGALVAERLRDPRVVAGLLAAVAVVSYGLGRRARSR